MADETPESAETPTGESMSDHARALRDELSPARLNESLEEAVAENPLAQHLLDFGVVLRAVAIAVVVALVLLILIGAAVAAIALVVVFLAGWYLLARASYDRRRETKPVEPDGAGAGRHE